MTKRRSFPQAALAQADDELLARLSAQHGDAFTELYRRHVQHVYRYLMSRVGEVDEAQELTAETFLAALQGIRRFQARSSLSTWLLGIARHKAADYLRQRRDIIPLDWLGELSQADDSPDDVLAGKLQLQQVRPTLDALLPERAEAIRLHVFAGLPIPEVAQVMHKNEAAVRMLLHRAIKDLRAKLAPAAEVEHGSR